MRRTGLRAIALAVASVGLAACVAETFPVPSSPPVVPSSVPSSSAAASPEPLEPSGPASATPSGPPAPPEPPPNIPVDLTGSTWLVTAIDGAPPGREPLPSIEFDLIGRPFASGFTGCQAFGFGPRFDGSSFTIDKLTPLDCEENAAIGLDRAFLAAFGKAETWSATGDELVLDGPGGRLTFARDLPPIGDRARIVADALRGGGWRIVHAPDVARPLDLPDAVFGDTSFVAAGQCGYSGFVHFEAGGAIRIEEVGWDTAGCADGADGRPALQKALEAVTTGRVRADGRVILSGALGEVVLGR